MRARAWLLVLVVAGAVTQAGTTVAQELVSADEYQARLRRALDLAEVGADQPSADRMADVRAALGLPARVGVGEWTVEVTADPVLDALRGLSREDFERARARLVALERSLDDAVARDVSAPDQMADALARAYRGTVQARPDPLDAILRAIGDVIAAVLYRLSTFLGDAGSPLAWLAVVIAVVGAGVLIVRRARLVPEHALPSGRSARRGAGTVDWARMADEAIRAGDLREAVRALYLALLVSLAGRGLLADAPALTAGEARSAVGRTRPALYPAVARATDSYERVIYGGADPDDHDLEHLRRAAILARTT